MYLWILVVGFVAGFALAFSIGANDVANSFGTSLGSRVLTFQKACVLASIFEMSGSILMGGKVSSKIINSVIDLDLYQDDPSLLELGYLASLFGACSWLLVATIFKLPVSATHSIVGAVVGFTLVIHGSDGVNWVGLMKIVASWFISPMLAGIISSSIYYCIQHMILRFPNHKKQLERGIVLLPIIYAITFSVNVFSILYEGSPTLHFNEIPLWGAILASLGAGAIAALLARLLITPKLKHTLDMQDFIIKPPQEYIPPRPKLVDTQTSITETLISPTKDEPPPEDILSQFQALTPQNSLEDPSSKLATNVDNAESLKEKIAASFNEEFRTMSRHDTLNSSVLTLALMRPSLESSFQVMSNDNDWSSVASYRLLKPFVPPTDPKPMAEPAPSPQKFGRSISTSMEDEVSKSQEFEYPGIFQLFGLLQVLTACFSSFAHGGNDVSNAVGPILGLYAIYNGYPPNGAFEPAIWILALGGAGISLGFWVLGRRVIETVGMQLTEVTPPSGFSIELGAASTVLLASHAHVPVSTTHCKIGSVVLVGIARGGRGEINWRTFRDIVIAWAATVPATAFVSSMVMLCLKSVAYDPYDNHNHHSNISYWFENATNMTTVMLPSTIVS